VFKQKHKIFEQKLTKYISNRNAGTTEDTICRKTFKTCQHNDRNVHSNDIINMDKTWASEPTYKWTGTGPHRSEQDCMHSEDRTKHAHSTACKMGTCICLCLQEPTDKLGLLVQKKVDAVVTADKSITSTCSDLPSLQKLHNNF
jgi:hypothetical protein